MTEPTSKVVQVRDVPAAVHAELARQADRAGMSLNRYVLRELDRVARRGRNEQALRRAAARDGWRASSAEVVAAIRDDRERHG